MNTPKHPTHIHSPSKIERIAITAPVYIGSPQSIVLHTAFFIGIFILKLFGFSIDQIFLMLTTIVSLEAIYLAIFIQMTVNQHSRQIEEVSDDVEEMSKDVDHLHENIEEIGDDVEAMSKDIDTIQEDVKEIGDDVDDISENVEELGEEIEKDSKEEALEHTKGREHIDRIEKALETLLAEVQKMKSDR